MVNQLDMHGFSCYFFFYRVNNLKDRKLFSDQMNKNRFDSVLATARLKLFYHGESNHALTLL